MRLLKIIDTNDILGWGRLTKLYGAIDESGGRLTKIHVYRIYRSQWCVRERLTKFSGVIRGASGRLDKYVSSSGKRNGSHEGWIKLRFWLIFKWIFPNDWIVYNFLLHCLFKNITVIWIQNSAGIDYLMSRVA